jgi:hypothetical protein
VPSELAKVQLHELVVGCEEHVAALFLPESIGSALAENGVTPNFIIRELAEIVKTNRLTINDKGEERFLVAPRDRIAASKMLLDIAEKSAHVSGLIERISGHAEKDMPDGTRVSLDAEGMRLYKEGSSRTLRTLELLKDSNGPGIIDLEAIDVGTSDTECRDSSVRSDGDGGKLHGVERGTGSTPGGAGGDDEGRVGESEGERSTGVSEQSGGGGKDEEVGEPSGGDRVGNTSNTVPTEWWNERTSPAPVSTPDHPAIVCPAVPGTLAAESRKADVPSPPRVEVSPGDPRLSGVRDKLRALYLKTHPKSDDGPVSG